MIKRLDALSTRIRRKVNGILAVDRPGGGDLCVNCLAADAWHGLCDGCRDDLPRNHRHCHRCALPLAFATSEPLICGECLRDPPPFEAVITPWRYHFPVDRMIARYKYQGQRPFATPLLHDMTGHMITRLRQQPGLRPDLMLPSPMHRKRLHQRGFNQAEEIAEAIHQGTGIPWSVTRIRRQRHTPPQSGLDRDARLRNLRGAYRVTGPLPDHVAIVDDVVTTGATARVLAAVLQAHGVRRVQIWALARTPG